VASGSFGGEDFEMLRIYCRDYSVRGPERGCSDRLNNLQKMTILPKIGASFASRRLSFLKGSDGSPSTAGIPELSPHLASIRSL